MHLAAPPLADLVARAAAAFAARFGRPPTLAAAAPGRVNLIGEHTDYNGGFVLPIAIDRHCVAVAAPAADPARSRLLAADLGVESAVDFRRKIGAHERGGRPAAGDNSVERGSWVSYIAGVAAQFARRAATANLDIAFVSSLPIGGGLSSSAAVEVATATLLEQASGETLAPKDKALLCQRAEHEHAGVPCGIMDQFASVLGREGHAMLIDCRTREVTPISMPPPDRAAVLIINSNVHHALASGEYARRRATCEAAARTLGVPELRDADEALLGAHGGGLSDLELRRARHVVTENARTLDAAEALGAGDLRRVGRLMLASHASLRDDYEVSCEELDTLVEAMAGSAGVYGARMTGGGFGGCVVAIVEPAAATEVAQRAAAAYAARHGREASAFVTAAGPGAGVVALR